MIRANTWKRKGPYTGLTTDSSSSFQSYQFAFKDILKHVTQEIQLIHI